MPLPIRALLLAAGLLAASHAWSQPRSPAAQAYDEIQALRKQADALGDDTAPRTDADRRAAIALLDRGLARLDTPEMRDLADGNDGLRFRRYDVLLDKARLLERLGDRAGAVAAVDRATLQGWLDVGAIYPDLKPVLADPAAAAIRARLAASAHLAAAAPFRTPDGTPLTAAERVAGLSRLWSVARHDFAWFENVPGLDWDQAYLDALPKVLAARDTLAYYRELMRFTALLHDGHSGAYPPGSLADRVYARLGMHTARIEGQVVVTEVRDAALVAAGIRPGDVVQAIDGLPTADYAARFVAPYQSASTPQYLELLTFGDALFGGDVARPVHLTLRDVQGRRHQVTAVRRGRKALSEPPHESFELRPDGIAVLVTSQFANDAALRLLETHREELAKARGLVLDLRRNGGGSSDNGLALLSMLSAAGVPAMHYRVRADNALAQVRDGGQVIWNRLASDDLPATPGPKFDGPVAMLIGPATFSAAEDTAAAFKVMKRGPLVGLPSGGSTGQPFVFDLPGGGQARLCVKRDGYPDGSDFVGKGIAPDVVVSPTLEALRSGRDTTLEKAVAALLASTPA